jgi:hypothetical protein
VPARGPYGRGYSVRIGFAGEKSAVFAKHETGAMHALSPHQLERWLAGGDDESGGISEEGEAEDDAGEG